MSQTAEGFLGREAAITTSGCMNEELIGRSQEENEEEEKNEGEEERRRELTNQ